MGGDYYYGGITVEKNNRVDNHINSKSFEVIQEWVSQGDKCVEIEFNRDAFRVWVFSYDLLEGASLDLETVNSLEHPSDIDGIIITENDARAYEQYTKLKERFEANTNTNTNTNTTEE